MQHPLSYLVCGTPRSGTSLLCEALKLTGIAGKPEEYFWRDDEPFWRAHWSVSDYAGYMEHAFAEGSTPNGVFGAKMMMGGYFRHFVTQLRTLSQFEDRSLREPDLLASVFPNLRYIWVTRRNKVRQAVSFWRAVQTGVWAVSGPSTGAARAAVYDFEAIDHLLQEIVMREASWQAYFETAGVQPRVIVYEDFVARYTETVLALLDWLGIALPVGFAVQGPRLQKQADALSEVWVNRYRTDKQAHWKTDAWEYPFVA